MTVDKQLKDMYFSTQKLAFNSSTAVGEYLVQRARLCVEYRNNTYSSHPAQDVVIVLVFGRDLVGSLLSDFLPVMLSVLIGHLSNYFRHWKAAAATNLMILLVVVTLMIGISSKLPQTTGIKMIEVWVLVSLLTSFVDTLLQTYIHFWEGGEEERPEEDPGNPYRHLTLWDFFRGNFFCQTKPGARVRPTSSNVALVANGQSLEETLKNKFTATEMVWRFRDLEEVEKKEKEEKQKDFHLKCSALAWLFLLRVKPFFFILFVLGYCTAGTILRLKPELYLVDAPLACTHTLTF